MLPEVEKNVLSPLMLPSHHRFHITKNFDDDMASSNLYAIKMALSMVWAKHMQTPGDFRVLIAKQITCDKFPEGMRCSGLYLADKDMILLATDAIAESYLQTPLPEAHCFFLIAAHEAMHKVQYWRGDPLEETQFPSPADIVKPDFYQAPHEVEAEREALDAYKGYFPRARGCLYHNALRYDIPERSSYLAAPSKII